MMNTIPLQLGIPGGPELLVILLIAVLLFGANKIPKLARSTGEAMGEFQKGREEVEQELQDMRDGEPVNDAGTGDELDADAATGTDEEFDTDTATGTDDELISDAEPETEPETDVSDN